MAWKVTVDSYDPVSGRYHATGVVTDESGERSYWLEGLWPSDGTADAIARQFREQDRKAVEKSAISDKTRIAGLIEAAIAKLEA